MQMTTFINIKINSATQYQINNALYVYKTPTYNVDVEHTKNSKSYFIAPFNFN